MIKSIVRFFHALKVVRGIEILNMPAPFKSRDKVAVHAYNEYITQRTHYARKNDWPVNNVHFDLDDYDSISDTRYLLVIKKIKNPGVKVLTGMRLTKVPKIQESLSFAMWDHAVEKEQFLRQINHHKSDIDLINRSGKHHDLWDLTRLMTHTGLLDKKTWRDRSSTAAALLALLGAGVGFCSKEAYWIFTCDYKIKRFLDRLGLDHTVLAHGKISKSDKGDNYLCYSKVRPSFDKLYKEKPFIFVVARAGHKRTA